MTEHLKIDVAFPLTLDTEITGRYRQTGEDEYARTEVTLLDLIVEETARQFLQSATSEERRAVRTMVSDRMTTLIDARIAPMIEEAFAAPIMQTNQYGEPTGKTATLRELVIAEAQRVMTRKTDRYNNNPNPLDAAVKAITVKVFSDELAAEVNAAKATIREHMTTTAAAALAGAMAKAVGA